MLYLKKITFLLLNYKRLMLAIVNLFQCKYFPSEGTNKIAPSFFQEIRK